MGIAEEIREPIRGFSSAGLALVIGILFGAFQFLNGYFEHFSMDIRVMNLSFSEAFKVAFVSPGFWLLVGAAMVTAWLMSVLLVIGPVLQRAVVAGLTAGLLVFWCFGAMAGERRAAFEENAAAIVDVQSADGEELGEFGYLLSLNDWVVVFEPRCHAPGSNIQLLPLHRVAIIEDTGDTMATQCVAGTASE